MVSLVNLNLEVSLNTLVLKCCFHYFVFFVHLTIFAFSLPVSFRLSALLLDSFLASTVIGSFKKRITFLPFQ